MHQLAAYFKEREDMDSIITDEGFATYKIAGPECYIRDIWVHKDYRKKGIASELADQIAEIARKAGCTYLLGSVCTTANNSTESVLVLFGYGFKIHSVVQYGITFRKDL